MRTSLIIPSKEEFLSLFEDPHILKRGGSLSGISTFQSPIVYQKGAGLFSLLKGIGKRAFPFIMKNIVPEAMNMGTRVIDDVTRGRKIKDALRQHGIQALKGVARRATMRGGRIKKRKAVKNKCYKSDVFQFRK